MGVFCVDRSSGEVLGLSGRLWALVGQSLAALSAPHVSEAFSRDGYVPSWLARSWGALLFDGTGELVVVARPVHGSADLRPVSVHRRGAGSGAWGRSGELLSVYDLPVAGVLLRYAQFCSVGSGHTTTTLRPPAPASPVSPTAARVLQSRSGVLATP